MHDAACPSPISLGDLAQYWLGEFDAARESLVEAHIFECTSCNRMLEELVRIAEGMKGMARHGIVASVLPPAFVSRLKAAGARLREYHLEPGDSVNCTITSEDDMSVAYLRAPLRDVERLDIVLEPEGELPYRLSDVAFNAQDGAVVLAPRAAELRQLGTVRQRVRLLSVMANGESLLGEYLFCHSPSR